MRIPQKPFILLLGFLMVVPATAWAGGPRNPANFANQVILVPDDPNSTATIDGPWDFPLVVRVVTISDVSILADLAGDNPDQSQPIRVATAVRHPSGETVEINLLEVAQRVFEIRTRRGTREFVDWLVNTELPFTREAQLQSVIEGFDIHRQAGPIRRGTSYDGGNSTCWLTGQDVVQIPVLFDPDRRNINAYAVKIVAVEGFGGLKGRDGEGSGPDGTDGGDPAGNPDQPPLSGNDAGNGGTPDTDRDPLEDPLEGGDPGGNPDPPPRNVD